MLQRHSPRSPAAIGFAALDSQAAIPLLQQAKDADIPVVAFDSGVDSDIPITTASTDNLAAAALAADKMAELIGGEGKVAIVVHDQTSRTGIDRRDGFVDRIKENYPEDRDRRDRVWRRRPAEVDRHRQGDPAGATPTSRVSSARMKARPSASSMASRR